MNIYVKEEMSLCNDDIGVDPIEYSCLQQNVPKFCKDDLEKQIEALKVLNCENVDPNDSLNVPVLSSVKVADFASEVFINKSSDAFTLRRSHRRGTWRSKSPHSIRKRQSRSPHSRGTGRNRSPLSTGTKRSRSPHSRRTKLSRSPHSRGTKRSRSPHKRDQATPCQEDQRKRKRLKDVNWDKRNKMVSYF